MRICKQCDQPFSLKVVITGRKKSLGHRLFCFDCHPFGYRRGPPQVHETSLKITSCDICKQEKPLRDFYKTMGSKRCKRCVNEQKRKRDIELKKRAIAYKGGRCHSCGYAQHHAAFVFHHIGKKEMTGNEMRNSGWEKVRAELDKCQLLCGNCHHIVHSKRQ